MENASKALIIAGAILLAIVIISLGLVVVNNSRSAINSGDMTEQEIQTFNSKFTPFEGGNIGGTNVKTLLQTAAAHNQVNDTQVVKISLKTKKSDGTLELLDANKEKTTFDDVTAISTKIVSSRHYKVELAYASGRVSAITISEL